MWECPFITYRLTRRETPKGSLFKITAPGETTFLDGSENLKLSILWILEANRLRVDPVHYGLSFMNETFLFAVEAVESIALERDIGTLVTLKNRTQPVLNIFGNDNEVAAELTMSAGRIRTKQKSGERVSINPGGEQEVRTAIEDWMSVAFPPQNAANKKI